MTFSGELFSTEITATAREGGHEEIILQMLDTQLPYGCEFYGGEVSIALTPVTERCFLSLTQVNRVFFFI